MKTTLTIIGLCLLFEHLPFAQTPGTLDLTFATQGYTTVDYQNENNRTAEVLVQSDGKLVIVGYSMSSAAVSVLRFLSDGSLDTDFGNNGFYHQSTFGFQASSVLYSEAWSGALQPDGKILMGGMVQTNFGSYWFVIRLDTDGVPDPTFGQNGIVKKSIINNFEPYSSSAIVAATPDNKVLVWTGALTETFFTLYRLNENGTDDNTFGVNGRLDLYSSFVTFLRLKAADLKVLPNGTIFAHGQSLISSTERRGHIFKLQPDGTPHNNFGTLGEIMMDDSYLDSDKESLTVLPDEKLILMVKSPSRRVVRLNVDGSFDNTFGNPNTGNAIVIQNGIRNILGQNDSKVICIGSFNSNGMIQRYNPNGTLDATFGPGGTTYLPQGNILYQVAQQPDGKLITAGSGNFDWLIARHHAQILSSVEELSALSGVVLSPNPGNGLFFLDFELSEPETLSLTVCNFLGQTVKTLENQTNFQSGQHRYTIDVTGLPSGHYVLLLQGKNGKKTVKMHLL